jgi:CTP synthase
MRLGAQQCRLLENSLVRSTYGEEVISERHRHRYEFNNTFLAKLSNSCLSFTCKSADDKLVEVVEIKDHPWFIGCQFHPEFTSTPRDGHPLFSGFVQAARRGRSAKKGSEQTTEMVDKEPLAAEAGED